LVLNLLQANKALEAFWNRFERVWILWTDMLIEKEMGTYESEIYPFFVVQQHRMGLLDDGGDFPVEANFIDPERHFMFPSGTKRHFFTEYINTGGTGAFDPVFYVVYYDTLTQLFVEFIRKLSGFYRLKQHARRLLSKYVSAQREYRPYFASFSDCFLINQPQNTSLDWLGYRSRVLGKGLSEITEKVRHSAIHDKPLAEIESLLSKLTALLEEGGIPEKPVPILLDKSTVAPYRTLLYDREQGLLKTPQEQRAFFVSVLRNRIEDNPLDRGTLVEKYGQPLTCAICHCETQQVDPLLMRAFCTESCRTMCL